MSDTQTELEARLEIFFGNASRALCHVYARLSGSPTSAGSQLTGRVTGPVCAYARTLPASYPLLDCGPGESLLSLAKLPEPSFWTPEMPHEYLVEVTWRAGDTILGQARRTIGIRPLGVRDQDLMLDGKRWVMRGIRGESGTTTDLLSYRDGAAALVIGEPTVELLKNASHQGVLVVVAGLAGADTELRAMSHFAAVGIVILKRGAAPARDVGRNLLLAQRFAPGETLQPDVWAQVLLVDVDDIEVFAAQTENCRLPIIAVRWADKFLPVADARKQCDVLQRELAGKANVCGYIV